MANLETAEMVFRNPQAIYGNVVVAIPKISNSYRMVTDYRAVNDTINPAAMPMLCPCQSRMKMPPHGARCICCKATGRHC